MERELSHADIQELLGAYALDAVDPEERMTVERHLIHCATCRAEVDSHREAAALLVPPSTPPAGMWSRISQALEETPPRLELGRVPQRRSVTLRMATAWAAAAIVVIGFLAVKVIQQDRRLDDFAAAMHDDSLVRTAAAASADPDAERIVLVSQDKTLAANLVLLPDGRGYIVRDNLEPLSRDQTYQLWALADGARISLGVLGNDPGVVSFHASGAASGFAITVEQAGGVASTRNNPIVLGFRRS